MVSLAENARIPVDNPTTHLELTMIHEAMILEYSARHLALIEWAAALKLFAYSCIGLALFFPWGIAAGGAAAGLLLALPALMAKLAVGGFALALIETLSAPRCASSARRSSWAPPSCWRCWHAGPPAAGSLMMHHESRSLTAADQPAGGDPAAAVRSRCWRSGACCR